MISELCLAFFLVAHFVPHLGFLILSLRCVQLITKLKARCKD